MQTQHTHSAFHLRHWFLLFTLTIGALCVYPLDSRGDGFFTAPPFVWNKRKDINEPTQKAIIVYDAGREDLLLQVKYEGPTEEFGWLVPVPTLPKVERGSMKCFYELSRLSQKYLDRQKPNLDYAAISRGGNEPTPPVTVIESKTVGAYEVAVLSAKDANSLTQWLESNHFSYPKEKSDVIDGYLKRNWYFIAVRIQLGKGDRFELVSGTPKSSTTQQQERRKELASGELHPLLISFDTAKCVYPLKISSINGRPSEVQIYTLSSESLFEPRLFNELLLKLNRATPSPKEKWEENRRRIKETHENIYRLGELGSEPGVSSTNSTLSTAAERERLEKVKQYMEKRRELFAASAERTDPGIRPYLEPMEQTNLLYSLVLEASDLPECTRQFPRLKGKTWTLNKNAWTFSPEQMEDLEFVPEAATLATHLNDAHVYFVLENLLLLGTDGVPAMIEATKSSDTITRLCAASLLGMAGFPTEGVRHLPHTQNRTPHKTPPDPRIVAAVNTLMTDSDPGVRQNAVESAMSTWDDSYLPRFMELLYSKEEEPRRTACSTLSQRVTKESAAFSKIVELLRNNNAEAQASAVLILQRLQFKIPRENWILLLKNPHLEAATAPVYHLGDEQLTTEELVTLLQNPTPLARMMGLKQAERRATPDAIDLILPLLEDPVEAVRLRVSKLLFKLTGHGSASEQPAEWRKWWLANRKEFEQKKDQHPAAP